MRVTRNMLESRIHQLNETYSLCLSVSYFNGMTWIYDSGIILEAGTTGECYKAISHYVAGLFAGMKVEK